MAIFQDNIIRHTAVIPFGGNVISEDIKEGCSIIRRQAELLKLKFGSALASENLENEIVSIPGLRGRPAKEISVKNLSRIIEARMTEIIEQVYYEIKNSGFESRLIAGLVVTGGGAQMKHIAQLFEFTTGMDTRIGYPTEHLAAGAEEITSPSFSTGVGLVLEGYQIHEYQAKLADTKPEDTYQTTPIAPAADIPAEPISDDVEETTSELEIEEPKDEMTSFGTKRSSWFQDLFDKTRRYLEEDED